MTMTRRFRKKVVVFFTLHQLIRQTIAALILVVIALKSRVGSKRKRIEGHLGYSMIHRIPLQVANLNKLVRVSDSDCVASCRMDRNALARLCFILREFGGLVDQKYVSVEEHVIMFLSILAHHTKNRMVKINFHRSGHTVSRYLHLVLKAVLKIHPLLLVKPQPIEEDSTNQRWKWFKGCLGALDGTYIPVQTPISDKPRYRSRKGQICTNVLGVCNRDINFVYVLPGWEGSAADGRVLRDAMNRPNGLKIPKGNYYLCDNGYANCEGFLTPYRGVVYHHRDWPSSCRPTDYQEYFNMQHSKARNCIERAFGVMTMRWAILRSNSFYPLKVQIRLIMECFLIHNFIRSVMPVDPFEVLYDQQQSTRTERTDHEDDVGGEEFIDTVESSPQWNAFRDELAHAMYASRSRR